MSASPPVWLPRRQSYQIDYDRSGRSKGLAVVVYRRRDDADLAVSQFHKRTLDGAPMHVEIVEEQEPRGGAGAGGGAGGGGVRAADAVRGRGGSGGGGVGAGAGSGSSWRGKGVGWGAGGWGGSSSFGCRSG